MPGQLDKSTGTLRRLTLREAHASVLRLAGFISSDLEGWMRETSVTLRLAGEHPEPP